MANPRLRDIVNSAASGEWNIPEFQREFEWKPEQVAMLFNSLHRDLLFGYLHGETNLSPRQASFHLPKVVSEQSSVPFASSATDCPLP